MKLIDFASPASILAYVALGLAVFFLLFILIRYLFSKKRNKDDDKE